VRLGAIDDIALEISGTVIERLDGPVTDSDSDEGEDDDALASPLALAIDLGDNNDEPPAAPTPQSVGEG
jgi:exoribonuclease II